jgi:hypothetical protein
MSDDFSIEVSGNRAILENLDALPLLLQGLVQEKLEKAGEYGLQVAEDDCPVLSGYLKSRTELEVEPGQIKLTNDAPYAIPVILGHHTKSGSFVPGQPFLITGNEAAAQMFIDSLPGLL